MKSQYKYVEPRTRKSGNIWVGRMRIGGKMVCSGQFPFTPEGELKAYEHILLVKARFELNKAIDTVIAKAKYLEPTQTNKVLNAINKNLLHTTFSMPVIEAEVCKFYQVNPPDLHIKRRFRRIVLGRSVSMHLMYKLGHTFKAIGNYFGGFDHTTVMHQNTTVSGRVEVDVDFANEVLIIEAQLFTNIKQTA